MKRTILAGLLVLGAVSFAHAGPINLDPLGLKAKAAVVAAPANASAVTSIGKKVLADFVAAQAEAGPATAPVDAQGYACYSGVVSGLQGFGDNAPAGLVSTGESIWLLAQMAQKVAADTNCQAVCGRVQMLAGKVGGLMGSLTVPNVCGAFTSFAE